MREKVQFSEATPVVVKLDFNDGTAVTSRNGSQQYQYTVDDDLRIMYVDPPIRNYILAEGAKAGDAVQITKIGQDARAWEVLLVGKEKTAPAQQARVRAGGDTPAAAATRARRANAQQPTPEQEAALGIASQPARAQITSKTAELVAALICAIDAAEEAENYAAKTYNLSLQFDAVDIRTMANSIICRKDGR